MTTIKKEPTIHVTNVFDGGLQAKNVLADLIIEKYFRQACKPLSNPDYLLFDKDNVLMNYGHLGCAGNQP